MARAKSPAETILDEVLVQAVTPPLKVAGFRKTGTNYHRRHGTTVQVVNVQISHGSTWTEKVFYINAGIAFDAICELSRVPVLERPREHECDGRGTRDRLHKFISGAPDSWILRPDGDVGDAIVAIRGWIDRLRAEMDRIDGLATYRSHPWFDRFRPKEENAQILYLLGDLDGAWHEVRDLAALFSDRENTNRTQWWIENLRLKDLSAYGE